MKKVEFSTYNDGVVSLYRKKKDEDEFFTEANASELDSLNFIAKLAYEEVSKREQDLEFAEQHDFSLTLKIKTRLYKPIDNKCKAIIENYLYDVAHVDKSKTEMWLYLEGVKPLSNGVDV